MLMRLLNPLALLKTVSPLLELLLNSFSVLTHRKNLLFPGDKQDLHTTPSYLTA